MKNAAGLSGSFEYAGIWTGQSNSQPWGKPADMFEYALELTPFLTGMDFGPTDITIVASTTRAIGTVEYIAAVGVVADQWNTSTFLRFGTPTNPKAGYAEVLQSLTDILKVRWITLPAIGATDGYLVRESGKFASYEHVRVLMPWMPWQDIQPPAEQDVTGGLWFPKHAAPYPTPDVAGGQRLILPAPYTVPSAVTVFDDLALFLPLTRREGADGYGISELADAQFTGLPVANPEGHPITDLTSETFTFVNAIPAAADLTNGYLLIDWVAAGLPKRSWARIASNTTLDFTTDSTSWLGDGNPGGPPASSGGAVTYALGPPSKVDWGAPHSLENGDRVHFTMPSGDMLPSFAKATVTFDNTTDTVDWGSAHGLSVGDPVSFLNSGGALPAGLAESVVYYVRTISGPLGMEDKFTMSAKPYGGVLLSFADDGTGTHTGYHLALVPGRIYYVKNKTANEFEVAITPDHPSIVFAEAAVGTSSEVYQAWVYTAWVPHWKDNPFTWLPGPEFAYPSEQQQPKASYIHFRARGRPFWANNNSALNPADGVADHEVGALLPFASRVANTIGKRMNMVDLGIGSTSLTPTYSINTASKIYKGIVGWWNYEKTGFGLALEDSTSFLAQRIKRLITFIAPQALLAEVNTKLLRYISACHVQGEQDGILEGGRETYLAQITDYKKWIRDLVVDNSFSPFDTEVKLPFAQPLIISNYEGGGVADSEGLINDAIYQAHTSDEFAGWADSEDLPRVNAGHYNGAGMAVLGARLAAVILDTLDYALSFSSPALATNANLLRVVNTALVNLGQGARQITSLTEGTTEAKLAALMWPQAVRQLLSLRQWSWASRVEPAAPAIHNNPNWASAYVVPGRALTPISIEPPKPAGAEGSSLLAPAPAPIIQDEIWARNRILPSKPDEFEINESPSGHRLLFTNVTQEDGATTAEAPFGDGLLDLLEDRLPKRATIRYVDKMIDPDRFSPSFMEALSWLLAAKLAPPIVKGEQGEIVAAQCYRKAAADVRHEASHESVSRHRPPVHRPPWIRAR